MFRNGKIYILMKQFAKHVYLDMFYILDFSGSFYMRIENDKKKNLQKYGKPHFFRMGGGLRPLRTGPKLFIYAFPIKRILTLTVFCLTLVSLSRAGVMDSNS